MSLPQSRTTDVKVSEDIVFSELHLPDALLRGLNEAGFHKPSPIQLQAIPMGRFGVAQAKAGTGKTCVFGVVALEAIQPGVEGPQAIIVSPTREIALQTCDVITEIGKYLSHVHCGCFIGGTSVADDTQHIAQCQIVTGTPGRLKQLLDEDKVKLFVMDEADQLLQQSFWDSIVTLYSVKQILAFSATYPDDVVTKLMGIMHSPQRIMLSNDNLSLVGVKLFMKTALGCDKASMYSLLSDMLTSFTFHQCVIFSNNSQLNAEICKRLKLDGFPVGMIAGSMSQKDRTEVIRSLRSYEIRVLLSTDLTARGVDIEHINLVINLDFPSDPETFIHRVGRTGRFGSYGVAVSFITSTDDENRLKLLSETYSVTLEELPSPIPADIFILEVETPGATPYPQQTQQQPRTHVQTFNYFQPPRNQQKFQTEVGIAPAILETLANQQNHHPQYPTSQQQDGGQQPRARQASALQQLQQQQHQQQHHLQYEERGRARVFYDPGELPKNAPVLQYIKEKGWPEPRPLHKLMETEEWSHPKSVDIRKRVRAWKYDVYYAKTAEKNASDNNNTDVTSTATATTTAQPGDVGVTQPALHHGYISKVPPDVIKPLVEIAQKRRNISSGTYSAPTPTTSVNSTPNYAFSQSHNFHTFHVMGGASKKSTTSNNSSKSTSSTNNPKKDNYFF